MEADQGTMRNEVSDSKTGSGASLLILIAAQSSQHLLPAMGKEIGSRMH